MSNLTHWRNSILATLIYYDILDFPLTLFEVHKYLINPIRLSLSASVGTISLGQVAGELEGLVGSGLIGSKNGFYFLPGRDVLPELRIEREKIAAQKWKKFLRIAKWFQAVPYLRAVFASGSLAINNTKRESDFDVLVVIKSGRLYVGRIFLCLMASFFRARRTRSDLVAPDKFCFNHYLTDNHLNIKYESLYNAQTYANLKPVLVRENIFGRFFHDNIWINKYLYNFKPGEEFVLRNVAYNFVLAGVGRIGELILDSFWGDKIEDWSKKYQQKRIKNNPATYESGGRVIFSDNALEFHPRSFESLAVTKYNQGLKQFGIISDTEEKDSGLLV